MSTVSSIITIIICVLLAASIGFAVVKGIWSVSKRITVPIQIALFVVMLVCVVRLFCTKENAQKLYDGIEQTGIVQNMESTMRTALNLKIDETSPTIQPQTTDNADSAVVEAPAVANVEVKMTPDPQPAVVEPEPTPVPEPAPVKAPDYSHLDKGKKTFSYALPFSATVTVGFKEDTYRVVAESLGTLNGSEKKEIGNLILTSLCKYTGNMVKWKDKSKISIETRYDKDDNRTRVFATIPPDAVD